jgi:hypothetical protein
MRGAKIGMMYQRIQNATMATVIYETIILLRNANTTSSEKKEKEDGDEARRPCFDSNEL